MKIGIVSAEPSGDLLGRKILDTLEKKFPELTVYGVGDGDLNKFGVSNILYSSKLFLFVHNFSNICFYQVK